MAILLNVDVTENEGCQQKVLQASCYWTTVDVENSLFGMKHGRGKLCQDRHDVR